MTAPTQPTDDVICVVNVNLRESGSHRHDWKLRPSRKERAELGRADVITSHSRPGADHVLNEP